MAIYQPAGVVGNSRILVSVGSKGELMSFFYPHIDFAQNLREGMPALYLGQHGSGKMEWTFEPAWSSHQDYEEGTNILVTELSRPATGLHLTISDFAHPDMQVLVRRFVISNRGGKGAQGVLYQYLNVDVGEVRQRNAARYISGRNAMAAYWRNICLAVGGDRFDQWQCGKSGPESNNSAKSDMSDGRLTGQMEEIGDVDIAVGWEFNLASGQQLERLLLISAASNEVQAVGILEQAHASGWLELHDSAAGFWQQWVQRAKSVAVGPDLERLYRRSLLVLLMLFDEEYGAFLAAPEFDPEFQHSGGYGYCWPRDAAEVVMALVQAGCPELAERFFLWARRTQVPDGHWEQRYWLSGERGPAWSTFEDAIQVDETASVLIALGRWLASLSPAEQQQAALEYWDMIKRAARYLVGILDTRGLHRTAFGLWEGARGSFAYSNAAIFAGLNGAAALADRAGDAASATQWRAAAVQVKAAVMKTFWSGTGFAQRLDEHGTLDAQRDSSVLGLVDPCELLQPEDREERAVINKMIEDLLEHLSAPVHGGTGLRRFERDPYLGGVPGCVNTLWLARVLLRLALADAGADGASADALRTRALEFLGAAAASATPTGLLPEMITEHGGWAVPHAWAAASWIVNMHLLDRLNRMLRRQ
jgi:oligosaccharide amylase